MPFSLPLVCFSFLSTAISCTDSLTNSQIFQLSTTANIFHSAMNASFIQIKSEKHNDTKILLMHTFLGCTDSPIDFGVPLPQLHQMHALAHSSTQGVTLTNMSMRAFSRRLKCLLPSALSSLY